MIKEVFKKAPLLATITLENGIVLTVKSEKDRFCFCIEDKEGFDASKLQIATPNNGEPIKFDPRFWIEFYYEFDDHTQAKKRLEFLEAYSDWSSNNKPKGFTLDESVLKSRKLIQHQIEHLEYMLKKVEFVENWMKTNNIDKDFADSLAKEVGVKIENHQS